MLRKASVHFYLIAYCFVFGANLTVAQENTSPFKRLSVDFSYGIPFYEGDFYSFFSTPAPYQDQPLMGQRIYNNSIIQGSLTIPWKNWLAFRLKATQATIFYGETNALVNFKNSLFDFTLAPQFSFNYKRFNSYIYIGGGYHTSNDAVIFQTPLDLQEGENNGQVHRVSATAGFGLEGLIWRQFALFVEADYNITGSDRFDGFNGSTPGVPELEDEKSYLDRDKILSLRGGLRVYFTGKGKKIAERKLDENSSAFYQNPYKPEAMMTQAEKDLLTEEMKKLGVKVKLNGYTVEVNRAMNIEELKRQKSSAERVLSLIQGKFPNATVELLLEPLGFSVHIGGFASQGQAKSTLPVIKQYFSNGLIIRH